MRVLCYILVCSLILFTSCGTSQQPSISPNKNINQSILQNNLNSSEQNTNRNTNTSPQVTETTSKKQEFILKSSDEVTTIQGEDIGGPTPLEGKKVYTGHYTAHLNTLSIDLGEHLFAEDTRHDRKISTFTLPDGTLIGVVYAYASGNFSEAQIWTKRPSQKQLSFISFENPSSSRGDPSEFLLTSSAIEISDSLLISTSYDNTTGVWTKKYWEFDTANSTEMHLVKMTHLDTNTESDEWIDGGLLDKAPPAGEQERVVYNFYKALRYADGEKAVSYVIPEKREKGAYMSQNMTDLYARLAIPLRVDTMTISSENTIDVEYAYHKGYNTSLCEDTATVTLKKVNNTYFIEKILPKEGC